MTYLPDLLSSIAEKANVKGVVSVNEELISLLQEYAEKTEKQSHQSHNEWRKAYQAGKAEGLRLAKDLIEIIGENGFGS